jgi:LPXTG-motif cell wall-anchored protein
VGGSHFETVSAGTAYPDAGLTLDAVLAFAAAGVSGDNAAKAMDWIGQPANLGGYVGDGTAESYAGALAKLALTAQVEGLDPTAFGPADTDLLARLRDRLAASGRFSDKSQYGDFSNAFGQSYAILALDRAGGAPPAAVAYLAGTECGTGGFPLEFDKPTCVPNTDATALVAQALAAAGDTASAGSAVRWLLGQQRPDGSFGGGTTTEAANANSTGIAAQALAAAGETAAAARAAGYLRALQSGCAAPAARRGAIQYRAGAFDLSTAPRATAQAVLGLVGTGLAELDGTGAAAAAPVLACAPAPAPTTTAPATTAPPTTAPPTHRPTPAPVPVQPPATPAGYGAELPATGADPAPVAWLGVGLLGAGVLLAVAVRRRPSR